MTNELPQPTIAFQNRAANSRRAVYFCLDDRYVPYALFLISQIRAVFSKDDFDICLVSDKSLAAHPLMEEFDLRIVHLDVGEMARFALVDARLGLAAYLRAFMPRLWAGEYDRLFYLDADIFYQRGDLRALFELNLDGAPLAAVLDIRQWRAPSRPAIDLRPFDLPFCLYFNSGVLLIDVDAYNAQNVGESILRLIAARGKDLELHDQTAMNAVLQGNWAELPVQWNYQYTGRTIIWASQFDVCFFHFLGPNKPFYAGYGPDCAFARRFTQPYHKFLTQHFPDLAPQILDGLGGVSRMKTLRNLAFSGAAWVQGVLQMEARSNGDFDLRLPK